jgi:hypothetical protein
MGTPAFMSPEQARGDVQHIDERTDVFALGALLFYVLAGRHPYTGTTLAELLEQARSGTMLPLDGEVPPALREICLRALAKDPKDRFANATELADALEASTAEALAGGRGAVRWLTGGLSVLAMLGLVSVMVSAWRFSPSFEALGNSALFLMMLSAAGLGLSATELWTGGRHRLNALALAVAMATVVLTPAVTGIAAQQVVGTLKGTRDTALARRVEANPDEFVTHVLEGAHELLGLPPFGFSLAALQLLVWGVARRRAEELTTR